MTTVFVIGAALLIAALLALSHWCVYRAGRDTGYEQRLGDERQQLAEERAAARTTGRHARVEPRTALVKPRGTLPIPGPSRIQPARDSGPGTVTFPRVQLADDLTDTGALRAIQAIGEASRAAIHETGVTA